jgi:hypothetical protein
MKGLILETCPAALVGGAIILSSWNCGSSPTSPTPLSLAVSCSATTLNILQQAPCVALMTLSGGTTQDQTAAAQWSSSNTGIASVSAGGLVTAVSAGSADVTARVQTLSATRTVVVASAPPQAILAVRFGESLFPAVTVVIQDVMPVVFDAGGSKGVGLIYRMTYGDGVTESKPAVPPFPLDVNTFMHQYHASGTFNAQLLVTDSLGRQASTGLFMTVKNLTGTWGNVIKNPSSGVTESRLLQLVQTPCSPCGSASLSGSYTHPEGNSESLLGVVDGLGTVRNLALTNWA